MTPKKRMTQVEVIERARRVAEAEGQPWDEPVSLIARKRGLLSKSLYWHVKTNCNRRGRSVIVYIDDETGEVTGKGWQPR